MTSGQFQDLWLENWRMQQLKGAIDALTSSLSAEVAHLGITVNAINPGPTDTGWMTEEIKQGLKPDVSFWQNW